jgi:hypothetical protein
VTRALTLCLLLGCAGRQPAANPPDGSTALQPALVVSDVSGDWSRGNQFPISTTRDLFVRAVVPSLPSQTMLTLRFTNPRGEVFYEDRAPFTTLDTPVTVNDNMFHSPRIATRAEVVPGGYAVTRMVPILGSIFQRSGRAEGGWGVTAELEGVPGVMSATLVFVP